VIIISQLLAFG